MGSKIDMSFWDQNISIVLIQLSTMIQTHVCYTWKLRYILVQMYHTWEMFVICYKIMFYYSKFTYTYTSWVNNIGQIGLQNIHVILGSKYIPRSYKMVHHDPQTCLLYMKIDIYTCTNVSHMRNVCYLVSNNVLLFQIHIYIYIPSQ